MAADGTFVLMAVLKPSFAMTADISLRVECNAEIREIFSRGSDGTTVILGITANIKSVGTNPWGLALPFMAFIACMRALGGAIFGLAFSNLAVYVTQEGVISLTGT